MRLLHVFISVWIAALCGGCGGAYGSAKAESAPMRESYATSADEAGAPPSPMDPAGAAGPMAPGFAGVPDMDQYRAEAPPPPPPPQPSPEPPRPDVPPGSGGTATQKVAPMLIYTATFHMAVFEAAAGLDAVKKMADDLGGYLVRRDDASITIRVPAAKYHDAQSAVVKLGDVIHRDETVEDVTEQFLDMQTRLKTKRAMQERLQQLLAQAKNVEEALAVERELARITEEIESMEGRLKVWRELVSFSTITVVFQAQPTDKIDSTVRLPFPWLNELGLPSLLNL
jgi:uncharacterized protein DUF4349